MASKFLVADDLEIQSLFELEPEHAELAFVELQRPDHLPENRLWVFVVSPEYWSVVRLLALHYHLLEEVRPWPLEAEHEPPQPLG